MNTLSIYGITVLTMSILTFVFFAADKRRAKSGTNRFPELTLLVCSSVGGALGGLLGMFLFRHKTDKFHFHLVIGLSLLVQIAVAIFLIISMMHGA